jgi:predicted anti-sigma-YlaC factor YlaD
MRTFPSPSWACDRARQAVSLRLDGELSQLERALLGRHLDCCSACAEFAADASALTRELRAAAVVRLERPIELPLRRRVGYSFRQAGAWAAAASVAATALFAVMTLPVQRARPGAPAVNVSYQRGNQDLRDQRALRIAQLRPLAYSLSRSFRGQQLDT